MMRKSTLVLMIVICSLMFYTACDDDDGGGGQAEPTPTPTASPPPDGGGVPPEPGAPMAPVPQTGQTTCWDSDGKVIACAGTGQDGDLRAGVAWPNPRFTDNGDGTITDNLTGLVWLKDANCFFLRDWAQALEDANTLHDGECDLLDFSAEKDWRLPNGLELMSLVDFENVDPALPLGAPFVNVQTAETSLYWSSTTYAMTLSWSWNVSFIDGSVTGGDKTVLNFVFPVRAEAGGEMAPGPVPQTGQTTCWDSDGNEIKCGGTGQDGDIRAGVEWPNPRFTDNGDGTIRDNLTGLIWLKDANCLGGTRTWQQALDFANTLSTGECGLMDDSLGGDWRLPNSRELLSLLDFENVDPALPPGQPFFNFRFSPGDYYWSSTTDANSTSDAWVVFFATGDLLNINKTGNLFVLPVRGGS